MEHNNDVDVIIIGGSYAGLSAAMALGRSLRRVLVIDSRQPCNRYAAHAHNFLAQDGQHPQQITDEARAQLLQYDTVRFLDDEATAAKREQSGFIVDTKSGQQMHARKLLFATGIRDLMPDIAGFTACWGVSVVDCPYCHGYEYRGRKTGIMANGEVAMRLACQLYNLTKDITIVPSAAADFDAQQTEQLTKHGIKVIESEVVDIRHDDGHVSHLVFKDDRHVPFDVVYAPLPFAQQCDIPQTLGCEFTPQGYIKINNHQKTTVEDVFACGDNSNFLRSIANAVHTGNKAGAIINKELADEEF